jgi:spermidine synthase
LALIWISGAVPFFFSGLVVSVLLLFRARDVSRLYFFDLGGAAVGAVAAIPLLDTLGGIDAQLAAAVLACSAAVVVGRRATRPVRYLSIGALALALVLLAGNSRFGLLHLHFAKGEVREVVEFEDWNSFSFVTVSAPADRPAVRSIKIDADAETLILRRPFQTVGSERLRSEVAPRWVSSAANLLLDRGDVLIIGSGGGADVAFAVAFGAETVDAVEINPIIVEEIMLGKYADFSGDLYRRPEVTVHVAEGRSFISRSDNRYDLVQLTLVDSWAATAAGAFSLSENHLYTIEAFVDYMRHLENNGVLAVTRWLFPRPRQTLRLMSTAYEAARTLGVESPERHMVVAAAEIPGAQWQEATFLFKRSQFTQSEVNRLRRFVRAGGGRIVYDPLAPAENAFGRFARADDKETFAADYEFDIRPVSDRRPFFFNTVKAADLGGLFALESESRKSNLGLLNLLGVGLISAVMVVVFLVTPLVAAGPGRDRILRWAGMRSLLYFVAIGLGFILTEIALIQVFVLYLGHPVYALAVVLSCVLVSAGLGSLATRRFDHQTGRGRGTVVLVATAALILVITVVLPVVFRATFGGALAARVAISCAMIAPLGFLLGQPFPLELKVLEARAREEIPWAWALNGAASVMGSVAAVVVAMLWGFPVVLALAAACYLLALIVRA